MNEPDEPAPLLRAGIRVLVSDRQAEPLAAGTVATLAALARRTLAEEGVGEGELSLSFADPGEIEDLHVRYLGEPGPTDVLSFPMDGEDGMLGDVVVCPEVAGRSNRDLGAELRLLVVHGVLHLLGHDHQEHEDRVRMWALQERYSGVAGPPEEAP